MKNINLKKLNEELNQLIEKDLKLSDYVYDDATVRDYIIARVEHIEESMHQLSIKFPEIKDTYEWEDIENQTFNLIELVKEVK